MANTLPQFSGWRLARRSWRFYRMQSLALLATVAVSTAILTGALVVGDSLQGSLRDLALDRLQGVDQVVLFDHLFRQALLAERQSTPEFSAHIRQAAPFLLLPGTLEAASAERERTPFRAAAQIWGIEASFAGLSNPGAARFIVPSDQQVIVTASLAEQLGVTSGDEVLVRLATMREIPADSPLGKKTEPGRTLRLTVERVVDPQSLTGLSLAPSQQPPANAWVSLETLQGLLEEPEQINGLALSLQPQATLPERDLSWLAPTLADLGLELIQTRQGTIQLQSRQMLLTSTTINAAQQLFKPWHPQTTFSYLANWIDTAADADSSATRGRIPYSTITALSPEESADSPFTLRDAAGQPLTPLEENEIVLNQWAADDFAAQGHPIKVGDPIELTFFEPESTHGNVVEQKATFRLKGVVPLAGNAADPELIPPLKGVSDQASISDWDPPFPYDPTRVRSRAPHREDEDYWEQHRTTPKGFIALAAAEKLWHSRFGTGTTVRFRTNEPINLVRLGQQLQLDPFEHGFRSLPLKALALGAASGSTPFGLLFLGFSLFLMVASLLLVALAFRLHLERRFREVGLMLALGFTPQQVRRQWLREGAGIALLGAIVGVPLGILNAALLIIGLNSPWLWQAAMGNSFLKLHCTWQSALIGALAGSIVALLTLRITLRRAARWQPRQLLSGVIETVAPSRAASRWGPPLLGLAAIGLLSVAGNLSGEERAGMFLGAGFLLLCALLWQQYLRLANRTRRSTLAHVGGSWSDLAPLSLVRQPLRSVLTVGLVAATCFLLITVSLFEVHPPVAGDRASGTGGFALWGEFAQGVVVDLNAPAARADLGFSRSEEEAAQQCKFFPFRVQSGDDASCLNLYQARQPRVLGVTPEFMARGGWEWASAAGQTADERANPWQLLARPAAAGEPIPVVLDFNTAQYALHLGNGGNPLGSQFEIRDQQQRQVRLVVVGLLKNSLFQGELLIGEANFLKLFPRRSGANLVLIQTEATDGDAVRDQLSRALGDYGAHFESTNDRLASLLAVQNTYLATFQMLGALGLVLGTIGLATAQVRSLYERQAEWGRLRAIGFSRQQLQQLARSETWQLLLRGLLLGTVAALIAVLPQGITNVAWLRLFALLLGILASGLLVGHLGARQVSRIDLLGALRHE